MGVPCLEFSIRSEDLYADAFVLEELLQRGLIDGRGALGELLELFEESAGITVIELFQDTVRLARQRREIVDEREQPLLVLASKRLVEVADEEVRLLEQVGHRVLVALDKLLNL